jgi:hypothetical protein
MTGRFGFVVGLVAVLAVAGCGKPPQPGGLPSAPSPASASPPSSTSPTPPLTPATTGTPEAQIDAQTRLFVTHALPAAYLAAPSMRRSILQPVTMEPALTVYLDEMAALDKKNQQQRLDERIIGLTVQRSGSTALARTCVDSTRGGLYDKATNTQLTKGVPREILLFTLKPDQSNVWKVSGTSAKGETC